MIQRSQQLPLNPIFKLYRNSGGLGVKQMVVRWAVGNAENGDGRFPARTELREADLGATLR